MPSKPREVSSTGPPKNLAEVTELHACHMLYQAQQIGTGRRQQAADVVFAPASQLAKEIVALDAQVVMQSLFFVRSGSLPKASLVNGRAASSRPTRRGPAQLTVPSPVSGTPDTRSVPGGSQ